MNITKPPIYRFEKNDKAGRFTSACLSHKRYIGYSCVYMETECFVLFRYSVYMMEKCLYDRHAEINRSIDLSVRRFIAFSNRYIG